MVTVSCTPSLQVRGPRRDHPQRSDQRKRSQRPRPPKISNRGAQRDPRGASLFFLRGPKTNQNGTGA